MLYGNRINIFAAFVGEKNLSKYHVAFGFYLSLANSITRSSKAPIKNKPIEIVQAAN